MLSILLRLAGGRLISGQVLSFVYERQRVSDTKSGLPEDWSDIFLESVHRCDEALQVLLPTFGHSPPAENRDAWLIDAARDMLAGSQDSLDAPLAFIFVAAQLNLSTISMEQRAQTPRTVNRKLRKYLVSRFYPTMFRHLSANLANTTFFPDLDGNLYLVLLNCVIQAPKSTLQDLLGPTLAIHLTSVWKSANLTLPNLSILASNFAYAPQKTASKPNSVIELLPFSHPIFDKYLPKIASNSDLEASAPKRTRIQELCDELFIDSKHWHNSKSILPKHLGGQDDGATAISPREKMKQLRRDQRFMANRKLHVLFLDDQ
jgi:hypothetical protein